MRDDRPPAGRSSCSTPTKPDGTPRKLLDVSRLHALGWRHRIALRDGIASSYRWFLENHATARGAEKGAAA